MLNHISLSVGDLERARDFYDAVLGALGYAQIWADGTAVGYGPPGDEDRLALKLRPGRTATVDSGSHVALSAPDRDAVDRFHAAAIMHGGHSDGAPGLRPHYAADYYAAFVIDPDGHRLEAVCCGPSSDSRTKPRELSALRFEQSRIRIEDARRRFIFERHQLPIEEP
jgi:catechol 2,3-dioxygenase-like lactoylglutathione lyase family enzyme